MRVFEESAEAVVDGHVFREVVWAGVGGEVLSCLVLEGVAEGFWAGLMRSLGGSW